jgi:hypothetical protein
MVTRSARPATISSAAAGIDGVRIACEALAEIDQAKQG